MKNPIGIFDSGVGGLSVLKEIKKRLPHESIIYLADSSNCPYGSKSEKDTLQLSIKNIEYLLDLGCKLIVIACNTVTAVAIDTFRQTYPVPFVGMEPAVKPAVLQTKSKKIGVLATENTFKGKLFQQTYERFSHDIKVFTQPGNGLVELVEKGDLDSHKTKSLLKAYLTPMVDQGVDILVLGCTHYPFLSKTIHKITQNQIAIIDPAVAVARQTRRVLKALRLLAQVDHPPGYRFLTTKKTPATQAFVSKTMDSHYDLEQINY